MKLKDCKDAYDYFSGKTSDIIRYLGLAGIAIVWIFRTESTDKISLSHHLLLPTILLIMGLSLDLFHYIAGTIIWGTYHRIKEKSGINAEKEFDAPRQINWPTLVLFWSKIIPIVIAYFLILKHLFNILFE